MQLTIDSNDELADVLRVVGAMYDVHVEVVDTDASAAQSPAAQEEAQGEEEAAPAAAQGEAGAGEQEEAGAEAEAPAEEETGGRRRRGGAPADRAAARGGRGARGGRSQAVDMKAVRAWAREAGYDVSDRGRLPARLVEEYQAAQG